MSHTLVCHIKSGLMLLEIRMQIVYMIILELLQNFSDVLCIVGMEEQVLIINCHVLWGRTVGHD